MSSSATMLPYDPKLLLKQTVNCACTYIHVHACTQTCIGCISGMCFKHFLLLNYLVVLACVFRSVSDCTPVYTQTFELMHTYMYMYMYMFSVHEHVSC